jgi:hypothetical protein
MLACDIFSLDRLHWVMQSSLLRSLANRHRSTMSKMARKYKRWITRGLGMTPPDRQTMNDLLADLAAWQRRAAPRRLHRTVRDRRASRTGTASTSSYGHHYSGTSAAVVIPQSPLEGHDDGRLPVSDCRAPADVDVVLADARFAGQPAALTAARCPGAGLGAVSNT